MRRANVRLFADPVDRLVVFVVLEGADVTVQDPLQHVESRPDVAVVGDDRSAVEVGVSDLVGEITPRALTEPGELGSEMEQQTELAVCRIEPLEFRLDDGTIVVDGEQADGTDADDGGREVVDPFDHRGIVGCAAMKAAVLNSVPGRLDIEDVEIGEPGPREVLVRTAAAGVCHSDLHFMEGKYPFPCPAVLGHESAGVVEAVGSMVHYVEPGDHVITCLSAFCGHCSQCTDGHLALCENKHTELVRQPGEPPRLSRAGGETVNQYLHLSSFAEQMLIHEQALVKIDDDMPLDKAALIGCGVTTGLGAVFRTAGVAAGETVAVIGCGGIGLSAIQGARIAGANKVIAVDMVASKLELAQGLGATHFIDASESDAVAAVKELTGGGVHHAFEAVGMKQTAEQAFQMLRSGGQATVIGMIPVGTMVEIHGPELLMEKTLTGSNMGSNQFRTDMPRYIEMYLDGRLMLDEMVSKTISLDEINEGFDEMKAGHVARSVVVFD